MYWYLSFLRPPPVSVSKTATGITITPQVANDLRTEIRTESTDIYYVWQECSSTSTSTPTPNNLRAELLTRYSAPASTYKSLSIPLPPLKSGQAWRLGLFPSKDISKRQHLSGVLGSTVEVIGVWSEPIEITGGTERQVKRAKVEENGKGKGKEKDDGPKQTRIQREWATSREQGLEGVLKIVEQTSYDLDKKIWDSGLALAAWLRMKLDIKDTEQEEDTIITEYLSLLSGKRNSGSGGEGDLRVLELGSGTGLVSIALRQCLTDIKRGGMVDIAATDLDSAMELMEENIALNDIPTSTSEVNEEEVSGGENESGSITLSAKTLDWDNPLPDWVTSNRPNCIVAADVTYNTSSFPCLVRTLRDLMLPSTGERPPLLLAYKQRDEAERELWGMLNSEGIVLTLVDKVQGAEEDGETEIWIGKATS